MALEDHEHGVQPLDAAMEKLGLQNDDLVRISTRQLTHKQVQKARHGRRVTPNIKNKIFAALKACAPEKEFYMKDLFNY